MKIKILIFTTFLLIAEMSTCIFAEDNTQAGLPEGAIARFGKGGINIMRFSPDGKHLAVGTDVGVWLYGVQNGDETALFTGHTGHVNALAFSSDGKMLASGGFNNPVIQIWDIDTKRKHRTIRLTQHPTALYALVFYGKTLTGVVSGRRIKYWLVDTGNILLEIGLSSPFENVVFSQDGSALSIADREGQIHLWDTTSSSQQATLIGHRGGNESKILRMAFSSDKNMLASGSEDRTVKLWNTQTHTEIVTLKGHSAWVTTVAFSEDGNTFASRDASKVIKLWDLDTRNVRNTLTGHKNTINA